MSSRFFKVGEFTTFVHTRYLGASLPLIHVAKQSLRSVSSWYLVFISWGNSKNSMWLSFGVSSRYLCVYFQEIRKTQHLLIRSAICHTVRRLHSAPRSLRCMCKWVVLEITKHRLGRLFDVHLIPIVMTYSEPWSFLNLELRYPERLVFERNSSRTLLLRALSSTHTIDKYYLLYTFVNCMMELDPGWVSYCIYHL